MSDDIVVIREPQSTVVVSSNEEDVLLSAPGPQGIPGPQGPAGGEHFSHVQSSPSTDWAIAHNLGYRPNVSVILPDGQVITDGVRIDHIDENNLFVRSNSIAISGRAELS